MSTNQERIGQFVGLQTPLLALTNNTTVYVDSSTGNDSNPGTQALPFQTLSRAWTERKKYGELRARFIIQLIGAGPYTLPIMHNSACAENGFFVLRGDSAAETEQASGTATGDFAANVIPVNFAVAPAVDGLKHEFIRITSGAYAGAVMQIIANTTTSISVANRVVRTAIASAITNGTTFQVIRPGTAVAIPANSGDTSAGIANLTSGNGSHNIGPTSLTANRAPRHLFYDLRFTTTQFNCDSCTALFSLCRFEIAANIFNSNIIAGGFYNTAILGGFGADSNSARLIYGAGIVVTSLNASLFSSVSGIISATSTLLVLDNARLIWDSGSTDSTMTISRQSSLDTFGTTDGYFIVRGTITASRLARVHLSGSTIVFVVVSGDCFTIRENATLHLLSSVTISGGTSAASGYGINVANGGKAYMVNRAVPVTGGTAGNDIHTTTLTAAAASLAVAGDALSDSAHDEIILRTAA